MIRIHNKNTGWTGRERTDSDLITLQDGEVKLQVIKHDRPNYNPETQRLVKLPPAIDLDELTYTEVWQVVDYTEQEIADRRNLEADARDQEIDTQLVKEKMRSEVVDLEDNVDKYLTLYPYYRVGVSYEIDDIFQYENELYEVIQSHTSQFDWKPDELPALYRKLRITIEEWVQPQGAHDSYNTGDRVTWNGSTWESEIDNNVWEPGVHGWKII